MAAAFRVEPNGTDDRRRKAMRSHCRSLSLRLSDVVTAPTSFRRNGMYRPEPIVGDACSADVVPLQLFVERSQPDAELRRRGSAVSPDRRERAL
jgi:hypothetical protein